MHRRLRSHSLWIDRREVPPNDGFMNRILDVPKLVRDTVKPLQVRFVLGEEKRACQGTDEPVFTEDIVARFDHRLGLGMIVADAQIGSRPVTGPAPGISKPERRQEVKHGRRRAAIRGRGANQNVVFRRLGILDRDIEEAILEIKDLGVELAIAQWQDIKKKADAYRAMRARAESTP